MTPELYAKFEETVKTGVEVVLPYTGVDFRLDEGDTVYFVNVRLYHGGIHEVFAHAVVRETMEDTLTFEIPNDDPLAVAAFNRAIA